MSSAVLRKYIEELSKALPNVEFASEHYRIYEDFVRSLMHCGKDMQVMHPWDYSGQEAIKLVCSGHPMYSGVIEYLSAQDPKEFERRQRRYTQEWIGFLKAETLPLKEVHVCSSVNQAVFDALCTQKTIASLRIKRLTCRQIDAIANLKGLRKLFLESARGVADISPIAKLSELEVLILGDTNRVRDYSVLAGLKRLKVLGICSYGVSDARIPVKDLEFLKALPALEYVDVMDSRLVEKN